MLMAGSKGISSNFTCAKARRNRWRYRSQVRFLRPITTLILFCTLPFQNKRKNRMLKNAAFVRPPSWRRQLQSFQHRRCPAYDIQRLSIPTLIVEAWTTGNITTGERRGRLHIAICIRQQNTKVDVEADQTAPAATLEMPVINNMDSLGHSSETIAHNTMKSKRILRNMTEIDRSEPSSKDTINSHHECLLTAEHENVIIEKVAKTGNNGENRGEKSVRERKIGHPCN